MKRYKSIRYHSFYYRFILIAFVFIPFVSNAQDKPKNRKNDSIYFSNGIKEIAEQVDKNGWIKFKSNSNLKADDFFYKHKEKLGLNEKDEMILKKYISDNMGFNHHRYIHKHDGIKVEFSEINLHEKNGNLVKTSGKIIPQITINTKPSISENEAFKYVLEFLTSKFDDFSQEILKSLKKIESELVILTADKKLGLLDDYLAYKYNVYSNIPLYGANLYIDAHSGRLILEIPTITHTDAIGTTATLYSGTRTITTDYNGNTHRLRDYSRGANIFTFDMNNGSNFNNAVDFTDLDNNWTPADAGNDVHWGIEMTYDYFQTYGRNSYDDAGSTIESYVHTNLIGLGYQDNNNAFWDRTNRRMVFGDGNGATVNELTSLDVVAHEYSHAVTSFTANLAYINESGALNESFSDIFGTAVEFFAKPANANWIIGDEFTTNTDFQRSMSNPNSLGVHAGGTGTINISGINYCSITSYNSGQPDTYNGTNWFDYSSCTPSTNLNDMGGVHINSGVQNFWFFLLSQGGSGTNDNGDAYDVTGIGIENATAIAYRNLTVYLTSNSNFETAREGSIEAANDLFGVCSNEVIQVINAWNAVGVYGPSATSTNIYACGNIADKTVSIASNNIYAGNYCSGGTTTINPGTTVVFRAGNSIRLNRGFAAKPGCIFKANTLACGSGMVKNSTEANNIVYSESNYDVNKQEDLQGLKSNLDFIIYPNPIADLVNIEINNYEARDFSVSIYDLSGSLIYNSYECKSELSINLSDKPSGIFFISISDGYNTVTKKIIKN